MNDLENKTSDYVSREEYEDLLRKYNKINMELYNFKQRKSVRLVRKCDLLLRKINIYGGLNTLLKKVGMPKLFYNNFVIKKVDKLSLYEYKFFRYKRTRMEKCYLDSSKIRYKYGEDLISVILPICEETKYLKTVIDSVLKQSYNKIELIIVNSLSTNEMTNIIDEYTKKDKRIKVIIEQKQELSVCLNRGIEIASGEYIMYISPSERLLDNCIEEMYDYLKKNPKVDFCFPNVTIVGVDGRPYKDNEWYPTDEVHTENAMLPHNMLNLCSIKDNTIAPVCLYKSLIAKTLRPFSMKRLTLEKRDYWMRANDLFIINHIPSDLPLLEYRQIKDNSPKYFDKDKMNLLMLYEAFRQDFYLMPLVWIIDNPKEHPEIVSRIEQNGHMLISRETANHLVLNDIYNNVVYLHFDSDDKFGKLPNVAYKVVLCDKPFKGSEGDLYITTNANEDLEEIDYQKGFFGIDDYDTIFSFIDTKAKEFFLKRIEDYVEDDNRQEEHPVSVCVVTYKRTEKVPIVLESLLKQSEPRENFEILVVNNDIYTRDIYDLVEEIRQKYHLSNDFLRYVEAPIKGVAYARNVGAFEARGDIIHWLDDDSISDYDNVHEMRNAFKEKPNAGVIGGNIILKLPDPRPEIVLPGKEKLWSEWFFEGDEMIRITKWFMLPYGANYATKKRDLLRVGGFRLCYGRVGHNWIGGEETASSAMIRRLGREVWAQPKAIVHHDPQHHRYSYEHVRNTLVASPQTTLKLETDLVIDPEYHNVNVSKRAVKHHKREVRKMDNKIEKFYEEQLLEGHKRAIENLRQELAERIKFTTYRKDMTKFIKNK